MLDPSAEPELLAPLNERDKQARKMLSETENNRYPHRDYVLVGLMYWFGLSVRDVIGIRGADLEGCTLTLSRRGVNTPRATLRGKLAQNARHLQKFSSDEYLFESQLGGALKRQTVNYVLAITSLRADVPIFSPSELRHLCGFRLAAAGHTPKEVAVVLGLMSTEHVMRYFE